MFRLFAVLTCCLMLAAAAGAADDLSRHRIITVVDYPSDGKKDDLYPDLSHIGLTCYPRSDFSADFLVTSTLPPGHQLFLSRNNGTPQPVASGRFTEPVREGKVVMTLSARGPLAAFVDSAVVTIERHGNELNILPQDPASRPWPATRAWHWDDPAYTATTDLPVIARADAASGAYAAKIIASVRERAAAAKVGDPKLLAPFLLMPAGAQAPSELQVATAIVATAWRNGLPARLVLTRNTAERVRWLIEFYLAELPPRGRWVLFSPETGAPFLRSDNQRPLATIEILSMVDGADKELPVHNAGQPVLADDFTLAAIAQDNDFAGNPRFRVQDADLTFVTFQPTVEEYAGLKRWSERIGIGLFIVALLGIIGIKLFGPEEPEENGDSTPPSAS